MVFFRNAYCPICESKVKVRGLCDHCRDALDTNVYTMYHFQYLDEVIVSFAYAKVGKELIQQYKFHGQTYLVEVIGDLLCERLLVSGLLQESYVLSYVPMTRRAEEKRGFNQSKLLCEYISRTLDLPMAECFTKIRHTKEQVGLSQKQRKENIKGVFRMTHETPALLLVDDVITTGATLEELAQLAKQQGTKKVAALVAATQNAL